MKSDLLDHFNTSPSGKNKFYLLGSTLSIGSLFVFVITTSIIISLTICSVGTILIWFSPVYKKEKIYGSTPLIGLLGVILSYWYIFSL